MTRRLVVLLAVLGAALALPSLATAQRIALPNGFQPEGVEAGGGPTVFVGSLADGSIWRGDVRTGQGAVWAPGPGAPALGIARDERRGLLWVAGGNSRQVRVYDLRSRRLLKTYDVPSAGFLNDVALTDHDVYVTDSFVQHLVVLRLGGHGRLPAKATTEPLTGDIQYVAGPPDNPAFNANGIVADHGRLVIDQSETGQLFRVNPRTGATRELQTFGTDLTAADGMELRGRLLYVVRNVGLVQRLLLAPSLRFAIPAGTRTGDLDVPSTVAYVAGALYVVNARFATPPTPTTPYWLTRLPA
jgi:streptogramin lyase